MPRVDLIWLFPPSHPTAKPRRANHGLRLRLSTARPSSSAVRRDDLNTTVGLADLGDAYPRTISMLGVRRHRASSSLSSTGWNIMLNSGQPDRPKSENSLWISTSPSALHQS